MQRSFCLNCKKEVKSDAKKCECGGESFAFGETLQVINGEIQCKCGSNKINRGMHMDYTDKYVNSGCCVTCGAAIGIETYRDKGSMMYWGDDYCDTPCGKYQKRVRNRQKLFDKRKTLGRVM